MKKLSILALAAVGLLVGACSTKDIVEDVQNPNTLDGKGEGFLSVNVNLPVKTTGSTRVTDGEGDWTEKYGTLTRLDDGTENEYEVEDLLLIIFGGDTEEDAVVKQVWSPTTVEDWNEVNDDPNQVTTRKKYVVKLEKGITGPYWVLAVVNAHGIITKNDNYSIKINGTAKENCKLKDLQEAKVTANTATGLTPFMNNNDDVDGFFMTNAVFSDQQGGHTNENVKALVLAPVSNIYESESAADAANAAPSADIYVERGLAKVTVTASLSFDNSVKEATSTATLKAPSLSGWVLDNTNMSSFVVRNAPGDETRAAEWGFYSRSQNAGRDKFRFVGYNNVDASSPIYTESAYRTYWSPDPNYATGYKKTDFFEPANKTFAVGEDIDNPQYCFENTFDVANQSYKNTTRVVAKVTLNNGTIFYTIGGDRKTLYQLDDVRKAIAARIMLNENFKTWVNTPGNVTGTVTAANFGDITFNKANTAAGTVKVTDIQFKKTADGTMASFKTTVGETGETILNDALNYVGRIQQYPSGVTYYAIRIKHFGDDLTPWGWNGEQEPTAEDITDAQKIAKIYPAGNATVGTSSENYLGRYGVLRNNWYELSLGKILKIGHPIVPWLNPDNNPNDPDNPNPEDPDHPDDSLDDSYISARINILSWAKRPQSVILK
ncbi:MAG: Mfa1 fimbrilin C-terminal domain-containing protein [Prevotella sp.]|nr:Mfa1 fimbrilin C-terminal domain-containing protein [Prevotella sp.]